jgi:hypothetical protein
MNNFELFRIPPPLGKRPAKLQTARDVRRWLSKLINATARNEVTPDMAARLGFLASILLRAIESSDFEGRIAELEKALEEKS